MDIKKIAKAVDIFVKKAEGPFDVTMEQLDTATPIIQELRNSLNNELLGALQEAATAGAISQGQKFSIGVAVGPQNAVTFTVQPANAGVVNALNNNVGPAITAALNKAGVDGNGLAVNNWLADWGWV